jgi:putative addiction module antidote
MKTVKVRKIGNSLGVIIPAEQLKMLGAEEGSELLLTRDGNGLKVRRVTPMLSRTLNIIDKVAEKHKEVIAEIGGDHDTSRRRKNGF